MIERTLHSLVSDVTPWWWTSHREGRSRAMAGAVVLKAFMLLDETPARILDVQVGIDGITMTFQLPDSEDATAIQSFADDLRSKLDGIVSTESAE